jgi:hypothetical protein
MSYRNPLQSLPKVSIPRGLTTQLQVLASREALRRRRRVSVRSFSSHIWEETLLLFNNLMRPYAVPCAGGLVSTLVLFSLVAPSFAVNRQIQHDVPISLATEASLASSFSLHLSDHDLVVDVDIDEQGRVAGYSIPRGQAWAKDPVLVRNLENTLLCTKFTPATFFGQPASGKTRITLRRSAVDVQG